MRLPARFIRPAFKDPRWHERLEFSCVSTRDSLRATFVVDFLTNLDVADCWVTIDAGQPCRESEMEFTDSQFHLPMDGSQLSNIRLANGLTIHADPSSHDHVLEYLSVCGRVQARLDFRARTEPVDHAFTVIGPGAANTEESLVADDIVADGRIDQPMHATGELRIDDSFFTVDCHSNRSHRWGTTTCLPGPSTGQDELHSGDELTLFLDTTEIRAGWTVVEYAYVVRKGQMRAVKSATVSYENSDSSAGTVRYEVTDEADHTYRIGGTVVSVGQLVSGPNALISLRRIVAEWNCRTVLGFSTLVGDIREVQRRSRAVRHAAQLHRERYES